MNSRIKTFIILVLELYQEISLKQENTWINSNTSIMIFLVVAWTNSGLSTKNIIIIKEKMRVAKSRQNNYHNKRLKKLSFYWTIWSVGKDKSCCLSFCLARVFVEFAQI